MKSTFSRGSVAGLSLVAAILVGTVPVSPQAPTPAAGPQSAAPAAPGPQAPAAPGQPGGRGGRGGLGGPQENDPANATADYGAKPPVKPLTPSEEQKRFWLPPGFKMEPVLTDPDIEESAQIAFDGNGRMFVLEIRGYMQDADATGELDPVGRISVHEDRDNDGKYQKHSIFVDKLIFPRFVMPYGANAVLTMESNADEVWKFTDTNNDSVADKKELFATGFGRLANVEHQQSGMFWAMDNWFYSTVNAFRARPSMTGGAIRRELTGGNNAQWGAAMDNYGKVHFQGGASGMPGYFQLPVHYGNFSVPDQFEENLNITWGAPVLIADMQGGLPSVRLPDGSLNRSTAGAGNDVFRGDRLPKDMVGDYFYGETVARIVRRLRPVKTDGLTQMRNVYPLSEFIRSTDPLFRPVDMTTAPDGTMYITDMYRGIIQQATWSGRGHVSPQEDRAVPARQGLPPRPHLAALLRRHRARQDAAADAERDGGAAGRPPRSSERLVARHRAAAAGAEAGQVGRAGAAETGSHAWRRQPARTHPRAVDARRPRRARRVVRARTDEGRGCADSHPGNPHERDPLQGRRSQLRRGLCSGGEGQGCGRGPAGHADRQAVQPSRPEGDCRSGAGRESRARGAGDRQADPESRRSRPQAAAAGAAAVVRRPSRRTSPP